MYKIPKLVCGIDFTISINPEGNIYVFGNNKYRNLGFKSNKENSVIYSPKKFPLLINAEENNDENKIEMVSCSSSYTVLLNYVGDVYILGNNCGKIMESTLKNCRTYKPSKLFSQKINQVSCGYNFSIFKTIDNKLYSYGDNTYGQLGLGNNTSNSTPQLISNLNDIDYMVCGGSFVICHRNTGEFYSWGNNSYGQLGIGNDKPFKNKPKLIINDKWPKNITDIKVGNSHVLLLSNSCVYSFGDNSNGQLGFNRITTKKINEPRLIEDKNIESIPTLIEDIPEIQRIECGNSHSLCVKPELNPDFSTIQIQKIECGNSHSLCVDSDGKLWVFGRNNQGQLGLGDTEYQLPILHPTLSNVIDISAGGDHTFVRVCDTQNTRIYAFGNNEFGQLGVKTTNNYQLTPIEVLTEKDENNNDIWVYCSNKAKSAKK